MAATSTDVVNEAIMLIGDNQPLVTGVAPAFDSSPAGKAAAQLYGPTVATVSRQFGWDFSRNTVALVNTGNIPPPPWSAEYLYPINGIQVRQLIPATGADPNNPLPVNWDVANNIVSGTQMKVIQCNLSGGFAVYSNQPTEATWDPLFREAVVRLLASNLAMALEARPDTTRDMMEGFVQFEQAGQLRDS